MSGRIGARGYVYQGIIAVLNCLETEVWDEIKVEPLTANDKVDIIMKKSGVVVKAIQVKSSDRKFEKPSIEKWIEEMVTDIKALKYELILVGEQYTMPASEYIDNVNGKGSNISIIKRDLNEDILLNMAKAEVTKFIQMHSSKKCGAIEIENIIKRLFADLMLISTNEKYYKKDDLIIMMEQNLIKGEDGRRILICFYRRSIFLMFLTYKQCIEIYGSDHMLKKEIAEGNLFQIEKGIYSPSRTYSELEIISAKYPKAVFSGESAFYYHGLTDVIPDFYHLATVRTDGRIKDERVKQTFLKEDIFDMGHIKMSYHNTEICIYNLERMLIELVRFRGKLPFDYYKEIIGSYRNCVETMDIAKVEEYAAKFKHSDKMMQIIELEVL